MYSKLATTALVNHAPSSGIHQEWGQNEVKQPRIYSFSKSKNSWPIKLYYMYLNTLFEKKEVSSPREQSLSKCFMGGKNYEV